MRVFLLVFCVFSLVAGQNQLVLIPVRPVPPLFPVNNNGFQPSIPTSNIDDPNADGTLAWPNNNGIGLMPQFPFRLWQTTPPSSSDWSPNNRQNRGLNCGPIPIVLGGRVVEASYPYQMRAAKIYDTVTYQCNRGRKMIGEPEIKCLPNRVWSTAPQCSRQDPRHDTVWLTSPPRNYDDIIWPDWFTTISRDSYTTTTPSPSLPNDVINMARRLYPQIFATSGDGELPPALTLNDYADDQTPSDSTTTVSPFIIRIAVNIAGLFTTDSPSDNEQQNYYYVSISSTTTESSNEGIMSNKAAYIGIIVGSIVAGLLIFGLTIFFLLRLIKRLIQRNRDVASGVASRDMARTPGLAPPPYKPPTSNSNNNGRRTPVVTPTPFSRKPTPAVSRNSIDQSANHPNVVNETLEAPTPQPTSPLPPPYVDNNA